MGSSHNLKILSLKQREKDTLGHNVPDYEAISRTLQCPVIETHPAQAKVEIKHIPTSTRKDLQLSRRAFHMGMGLFTVAVYGFLVTHKQAVYILGACASILYILEQVRINYPQFSGQFEILSKYFLRAEEHLKESSSIPYAMALLLTIITFPKIIALAAILTLALGDPLSALVGILYGKHHLVKQKTVEGSLAFFSAAFISIFVIFIFGAQGMAGSVWLLSFVVALLATVFEMIPIKLDDNLTIPLFTAVCLWIFCGILTIPT